jgi:hypothetical protein
MQPAIQDVVLYLSVQYLNADLTGVDLDNGRKGKTGEGDEQSQDLNGSAVTAKAIGSACDDETGDQQKNA